MGENNQPGFYGPKIDQLYLEKLLYSKKMYISDINLKNWNISLSAILDNAVFEITNTVLAEKKEDKIDVEFNYLVYKGLFDHFMDIMGKFKFLGFLKSYVKWEKVTARKLVELKQYVLYPSLDKTYPQVYKMDYNIKDVV